jgi:hypothetical protein
MTPHGKPPTIPPLHRAPGGVPRRHIDAGGEVFSPERRIDTIDAPLLY